MRLEVWLLGAFGLRRLGQEKPAPQNDERPDNRETQSQPGKKASPGYPGSYGGCIA